MDVQNTVLHPAGFSKPRAKTARKPCSAALLREFVSSLKTSDISENTKHERLDTNGMSTANVPFRFSEKSLHSDGNKHLIDGHSYQKEIHVTSYKKELQPYADGQHAGDERFGKANANGNDCFGSLEVRRSEKFMELSNGRLEAKAKAERYGTASEEEIRSNIPPVHSRSYQGNQNTALEAQLQVEGRPTKLKLKVGGVTHTLQTFLPAQKADPRKVSEGTSKPELKKRRQRLILQGTSDDEDADIRPAEGVKDCSRVQRSNVLKISSSQKKREAGGACSRFQSFSELVGVPKHVDRNLSTSPSTLSIRKSSRVVKKRVFDMEGDDAPETERKSRKKSIKDEDDLYEEEDDEIAASSDRGVSSDADINSSNEEQCSRKSLQQAGAKQKKVAPLTARQRALQSCKEHDIDMGTSFIEFPDGLPSSITRKQKIKLTEEEIQAKKAEAARRRKQQTEKAARDIQELAIQKILSQDSVRKKREGQLQKQREEMAQNKKAVQTEPALNSIRWIFGPSGTIVSWSKDLELPSLFQSGCCSYPPPREKCAVPTCKNAYKYRHSKLNLPLCSLECYRIVEKPNKTGAAC